ncbi:MAG: c-type cytochrome [Thiotrichales bacterium]
MKKLFSVVLASAAIIASGAALAGDAAAGKSKYAMCMGCHGANGVSASPANPSVAGKDAAYVKEQLVAYKTGKRENATMKAMSAGLSDADIDNLAAHIASFPKP